MASDGLWDELSRYYVADIARRNRIEEVPKKLIE